jgi:hypothetical protein
MNVPLRELEEALRNPRAYAIKKLSPSSPPFGRSKYLTLQWAVYRYHKNNADIRAAKQYLQQRFSRFKNQEDLPEYGEKLETYAEGIVRLKPAVIKVKDRLVIPLKEPLASQFRVGGDIPRVDLTPAGYSVWLFANRNKNWAEELRLPLIQSAYAQQFAAPVNEVRIGVYNFSTGNYTDYGFTEREIRTAERSLVRLLQQIALPA